MVKIKSNNKIFSTAFILLLIALFTWLVYKTGGTHYSYTHIMYVPIIIAAFTLGLRGGVLSALLAGLTLGPFMPENVMLGTTQPLIGWLNRTMFFVIVSLTVSLMLEKIKKLNNVIQEQAFQDPGTGLPNINKLESDMQKYIEEYKSQSFTILGFEFSNFDQITRYVDLKLGRRSLIYLLNNAAENFKGYPMYSVYLNEFVVILPDTHAAEGYKKGKEFINKFKELKYINGIPINFILNCGVISFPQDGNNTEEILLKFRRVMDQAKNSNKDIVYFEESYAEKSMEKYKILVDFYEAINQDKLTLFYQPKIDINNKRVYGAEALLRWKNPGDNKVSIAKMIKIVEDSGSITELTKWVTETAVRQLKEWQNKGININISVNISAKDLEDDTIVLHLNDMIEKYHINPGYFEYEITERTMIENQGIPANALYEFKDMGLTLSIDDYGTGYNSLMNMLFLPLDYIKIDKYFIDNIAENKNMKLIQDVVDMVHNLGKKVCAEGVEKKEQLDILEKINCDFVQGFYYSKAIPANDMEEFVITFNQLDIPKNKTWESNCVNANEVILGK